MWTSIDDHRADMLRHLDSNNLSQEEENPTCHYRNNRCCGDRDLHPHPNTTNSSSRLQYHPNQQTMENCNDDNPLHPHPPHHKPHHHDHYHDHHIHYSSQLHHQHHPHYHHNHHHQHPHHHQQYHHELPTTTTTTTTRTLSRRSSSKDRLSNFVWTIFITAFLSLIFLSSHIDNGGGVAALSCASCDLDLCPETSGCSGGLVIDICGCCQVCAKTENESCGGPFGIRGKCDRNLQCFIRPEIGKPITGSEAGICKEVKEFQCKGLHCPPVYEQLLCPRDSNLVTFASDMRVFDNSVRRTTPPNVTLHHTNVISNNNNNNNISSINTNNSNQSDSDNDSSNNVSPSKTPSSSPPSVAEENNWSEVVPERMSYCVCNSSRCSIPACAPGFSPVVIQNATGFPGSCCDIFTCNKTKGCDPVICPPLDETPCPDDSVRLPNIWTEDNCCELQHGCSCPSSDRCQPVRCPSGSQVQIIARATGLPGSCCDKFRCVNESGLTCRYDGREMKNGEKLDIDKCRSCVCKDGLNRCRDKTCSKLSCLWIVIPDDECCPICRGCVSDSGNFYNNSDVWKENDCTTCKCVEGQVQCQAELCAVHCAKPVRIPGQCCPACPEEETTTTSTALTPLACPSMDSCHLECPGGLELSPFGCFICKCKKEKCSLDCPYGLKTDFEGNTLCECRAPEIACPHWEEEQCDKKCEYGYRRSREGCIKCKCNRCPPLNCTKRCLHGLLVNDEGCRVCKCQEETVPELIGPPRIDSSSDSEHIDEERSCLSRYGVHHENGESWNDGCRTCYCHKGVEMCSLIACRPPHCSNPIFRVGDCCPSCSGLTIPSPNGEKLLCQSTNGDYYVEGQTWNMDPCTRCVCHGGAILCETLTCRPVLCHHPVKPEGQCCPICKGEDFSLLAPSPLHRRCKSSTGMLYKHREVWRSTPCQTCVCQDGQFHCYNQMCAPVKCNKTLLRKDQCCPTCAEPETKKPKICSYNNEVYDSEEKWEGDNCTQCMCSGGRSHCFPLTCPSLKCSVMVKKRGQCCLTCYEMPQQNKDFHEKYRNTTAATVQVVESGGPNYIGMIILGVILFIFACVIVYLVYRLYLQRQKNSFRGTCAASRDELQGQTPFLSTSQTKNIDVDIKQPDLEKLYSNLADKGNGDRAFNTYTDLTFCEQNKNNAQIF